MKTLYLLLGMLFVSGLFSINSLAQRSSSRLANYDAVTSYRIGMQSVGLDELNQALQQAGYTTLAAQLPVFSIVSQFSRPNRPLAFHSELGISFGSGSTVTNGTYKAKTGFYYARLGVSYRIIGTERFQLAPLLGLAALPFHMQVSHVSPAQPSLNTVLTNPGSAQTASLRTNTLGLDAGLTANWRFPYTQRQVDCSTVERSFVIGLDAGYRLAANTPLNTSYEISAINPAIQLSGWYIGLRMGFGMRVRSTTAPVTY